MKFVADITGTKRKIADLMTRIWESVRTNQTFSIRHIYNTLIIIS